MQTTFVDRSILYRCENPKHAKGSDGPLFTIHNGRWAYCAAREAAGTAHAWMTLPQPLDAREFDVRPIDRHRQRA